MPRSLLRFLSSDAVEKCVDKARLMVEESRRDGRRQRDARGRRTWRVERASAVVARVCAIAFTDAPRLVLPLSMWPKMPTLTFSTRLSPW